MSTEPIRRGTVTWQPAADAWQKSSLADFAQHVASSGGPTCNAYDELLDWSLADPGAFWAAVAAWQCVRWHDEPRASLEVGVMPDVAWFPGGTLNYAERMLAWAAEQGDRTAIVELSQSRDRREISWSRLVDRVARCRAGLVERGVERGDRVVAYSPNISETLVAFLATASLGAVWSSCAPEFGVRAVTDRWAQIEPKVMITVDGYVYGTKRVDRRAQVAEIVASLPTLEHIVQIGYLEPRGEPLDDPRVCAWDDLIARDEPLVFDPVPFDHPLYVLFSSGTTGLPKPIVHGHGGILLEHAKAWSLHYGLQPADRAMWFTTTGWMMWNFLISGLLTGSTIVLFDGDPGSPDLMTLWKIAADEHVDVFGVSAPFIMACRKEGIRPGDAVDLSQVRHLGSTGAPLPVEGFEWIPEAVGSHVQTGSMSGGTDVCTAFVGTAPTLPIRAGEIGARMLGCDVQAFTPGGDRCPANETGELVIVAPMPSMPIGLWGDESGERYRSTYFGTYPGVWHHGDWITFFDDGACQITGRSDATLNRGGVRLGTADFYVVVDSMTEIVDSVVVHLEDDDGGGPGDLILLVALADGHVLDDALVRRISSALRTELSPRHVPDEIAAIPAVPRTLSGKKLEVPIKRMLLGAPADTAASRDSLANPEALDHVADWVATRHR